MELGIQEFIPQALELDVKKIGQHAVLILRPEKICVLCNDRKEADVLEESGVKSFWGRLDQQPAWLLYLNLQISQSNDCALASATIDIAFQSQNSASSGLGPIVTDYFGPRNFHSDYIADYQEGTVQVRRDHSNDVPSAVATHGTSERLPGRGWSLRATAWPSDHDSTGLRRRVQWVVEDAPSCDGFKSGMVLWHTEEPFTIRASLECRLQGRGHNWFRFKPSLKTERPAARLDEELSQIIMTEDQRSEHLAMTYGSSRSDVSTPVDDSSANKQSKKHSRTDYTVAWICALPLEMAVAQAMLDEVHETLPVHPTDPNHYVLGKIQAHSIVVVCLPSGVYGTNPAAAVATNMLYTFPKLRVALMVGIGGGVPGTPVDIRLGDVVVSSPRGKCGGIIQYDRGRNNGQHFEVTGTLNKPSQALLTAVAGVRANHILLGSQICRHIDDMLSKYPHTRHSFSRPGQEEDRLFSAAYGHIGSAAGCEDCDRTKLISRPDRPFNQPKIHYGLIASGNQVMKHGETRDCLAREHGVLCFEMEAAGLMDTIPCLVIRGIADYADSHKSKNWQGYAAAAAAAYAKDLLSVLSVVGVHDLPTVATPDSSGR
ncbi:nucleoside phosphorylase domain-containing protein [Aspergillus californicus]